jgi:hypothetical protein
VLAAELWALEARPVADPLARRRRRAR